MHGEYLIQAQTLKCPVDDEDESDELEELDIDDKLDNDVLDDDD